MFKSNLTVRAHLIDVEKFALGNCLFRTCTDILSCPRRRGYPRPIPRELFIISLRGVQPAFPFLEAFAKANAILPDIERGE